jgi:hypothetical protein
VNEHRIMDGYLTVRETAEETGLADSSVRVLMTRGFLRGFYRGCWWIPAADVEVYMRTRRGRLGRRPKTAARSAVGAAPAAARPEEEVAS